MQLGVRVQGIMGLSPQKSVLWGVHNIIPSMRGGGGVIRKGATIQIKAAQSRFLILGCDIHAKIKMAQGF